MKTATWSDAMNKCMSENWRACPLLAQNGSLDALPPHTQAAACHEKYMADTESSKAECVVLHQVLLLEKWFDFEGRVWQTEASCCNRCKCLQHLLLWQTQTPPSQRLCSCSVYRLSPSLQNIRNIDKQSFHGFTRQHLTSHLTSDREQFLSDDSTPKPQKYPNYSSWGQRHTKTSTRENYNLRHLIHKARVFFISDWSRKECFLKRINLVRPWFKFRGKFLPWWTFLVWNLTKYIWEMDVS